MTSQFLAQGSQFLTPQIWRREEVMQASHEDENLDCLLQLGPGNLEEQDWQVPQGTIRPNLKGIFVESGISLA